MLRLILLLPVVIVIVLFALTNRAPVQLGLWPTDLSIEVPVAFAVLGGMGIAFLIGAIVLWFSLVGARGRARRAERQRDLLDAQVATLKADLDAARKQATSSNRSLALVDAR